MTYLFKLQLKCGCAWRVVYGDNHCEYQRRIEHGKYKQCEWEFVKSITDNVSLKSCVQHLADFTEIQCYQEHEK